jgi:hypothetical protein
MPAEAKGPQAEPVATNNPARIKFLLLITCEPNLSALSRNSKPRKNGLYNPARAGRLTEPCCKGPNPSFPFLLNDQRTLPNGELEGVTTARLNTCLQPGKGPR